MCSSFQRERRSPSRFRQPRPLSAFHQLTMIYLPKEKKEHGDEIVLVQKNSIVFKGYLRAKGCLFTDHLWSCPSLEESFSFQIQSRVSSSLVTLECFVNDLFECRLSIDCDHKRLDPGTDLFRIERVIKSIVHRRSVEHTILFSAHVVLTSISATMIHWHRMTRTYRSPLKAHALLQVQSMADPTVH